MTFSNFKITTMIKASTASRTSVRKSSRARRPNLMGGAVSLGETFNRPRIPLIVVLEDRDHFHAAAPSLGNTTVLSKLFPAGGNRCPCGSQ
jgi:hypothetical protein